MNFLSQIKHGLQEELSELFSACFLAFEWLEEGHSLPRPESLLDLADDTRPAGKFFRTRRCP